MLISEFARRAGVPIDTVRYYVRQGLLQPEIGKRGGSRPYQIFAAEHLLVVRVVRTAQSLGMSLKEIAAIGAERRAGRMTRRRSIDTLKAQLSRLQIKSTELSAMTAYLRAKIGWLERNSGDEGPDFDAFFKRANKGADRAPRPFQSRRSVPGQSASRG
jgi:MerR family copper efflux transcriptional regulator